MGSEGVTPSTISPSSAAACVTLIRTGCALPAEMVIRPGRTDSAVLVCALTFSILPSFLAVIQSFFSTFHDSASVMIVRTTSSLPSALNEMSEAGFTLNVFCLSTFSDFLHETRLPDEMASTPAKSIQIDLFMSVLVIKG